MSRMRNRVSGPLPDATNKVRSPTHDNDILVGEYYYGIHCPVCQKAGKYVKMVNVNLVGGRIDQIATDSVYEVHQMKDEDMGRKMPGNARGSFQRGGINATPTWFWSDGLRTTGGPYDEETQEINAVEMSEYLCIRAAKCFLKKTHPHYTTDQVHETVEQFFTSRFAEKRHRSGDTSRDAYSALRELTTRFR